MYPLFFGFFVCLFVCLFFIYYILIVLNMLHCVSISVICSLYSAFERLFYVWKERYINLVNNNNNIIYFKFMETNVIYTTKTFNYGLKGHYIRENKEPTWLPFDFREKHLHEVCLLRIKEQVGEKRSTIESRLCWTTRSPNNRQFKNFVDVNLRKLFVRIGVFLQRVFVPF